MPEGLPMLMDRAYEGDETNTASITLEPFRICDRCKPLRSGDSKGIQCGAQSLAHSFQPIHGAHRGQNMSRIGTLPPSLFEQGQLLGALEQNIKQEQLQLALDQACAKFA
jgi:hypothetical protein